MCRKVEIKDKQILEQLLTNFEIERPCSRINHQINHENTTSIGKYRTKLESRRNFDRSAPLDPKW